MKRFLLVLAAAAATLFALTPKAGAEAIRVAGGVAAGAVCLLTGGTGCTMTGQTIYSGVTTDITTGTNEDLTITPNGTGSVTIGKKLSVRHADVTPQVTFGNSGNAFFTINTAATPAVAIGAGSFGGDGASVQFIWVPVAKTITSPDTTTQPSSHVITLTSAGVATWTPAEANAANGACFRAINISANIITMTDSAGVYEGGVVACALGQYDAVTACYITDRWVEVSCRDN